MTTKTKQKLMTAQIKSVTQATQFSIDLPQRPDELLHILTDNLAPHEEFTFALHSNFYSRQHNLSKRPMASLIKLNNLLYTKYDTFANINRASELLSIPEVSDDSSIPSNQNLATAKAMQAILTANQQLSNRVINSQFEVLHEQVMDTLYYSMLVEFANLFEH